MRIERFTVQACCGRTNIVFKTDRPLTKDFLAAMVALGFHEAESFTKAGLLYVYNMDFILTGPLGQNRLQVTCKHKDCDLKLNDLEGLLLRME